MHIVERLKKMILSQMDLKLCLMFKKCTEEFHENVAPE